MDSYSCGEDLFLKARKPYTITKQRERWTEEEHNRFLEALKLHGRAWQRIEEHIGTKTAVQIRSHAQKFFSKLEKEAVVKGVSLGQTLEIEIPPPRPKRKPSYPYPRKSYGASSITSSVEVTDGKLLTLASSLYPGSEISESKNDQSSQNPGGTENSAREKETLDEGNCLEDNLFQEASCVSVRSASQSSISTSMALQKTCTFREFVPSRKDIIESKDHIGKGDYPKLGTKDIQKSDRTEANLSHVDINGTGEMLSLKDSCHSSQDKLVRGNNTDKLKKPENVGQLSTAADEIQANHSYPRHVPVHIVDMSSGACVQPQPPGVYPTPNICHLGAHGNPYIFPNLTVSAATQPNSNITSRSSLHHQTLPNFPPPFAPLHNQETQKSAENISSAFGGLLMSALLQNPAAHMAASLAASFWPTPNGETSLDSSAGPLGGFPTKQMSATPNLAAIAAATVAAASAWWAAHGMLPLCPPMHTGFSYPQPQPTTATPMDITHAPLVGNNERQDNSTNNSPWEAEQIDPEVSEATKPQNRTSKWQTLSSSDSAESGGDSQSNCNKPKSAGEEQNPDTTAELVHDSNKLKMRKKVDRSSCGSNTASSTEVETDALEQDEEEPEQDQKDREESKEADSNHQVGEHNRRSRSSTSNTNGNTSANTNGSTSTNTNTNTNESWKEVSEEGRIAFQALFTRQVLPQSFSPPPDPKIIVQQQQQQQQPAENIVMEGLKQISDVKDDDEQMLQLNLSSSNSWGVNPEHSSLLGNNDTESSFLSMGLGHGKFKARRTGFKPYKRCSVEAKESRITGGSGQCCEEKGPKRIRLEGDASTL